MTIEKLSAEQLEARIRWHEGVAAMFASCGDSTNAGGMRELAETYRKELALRAPAIPKAQRCAICGGSGRLASDDYCMCRTGRDLRRTEES